MEETTQTISPRSLLKMLKTPRAFDATVQQSMNPHATLYMYILVTFMFHLHFCQLFKELSLEYWGRY